jgi:hypothetical protein
MKVKVRGLAPGVAACTFRGVKDTPTGDDAVKGHGQTEYSMLWRIEVKAAKPAR